MSECRKLVLTSPKTYQAGQMLTALTNKRRASVNGRQSPTPYWQDLVSVFLNVSHLFTDCDGS